MNATGATSTPIRTDTFNSWNNRTVREETRSETSGVSNGSKKRGRRAGLRVRLKGSSSGTNEKSKFYKDLEGKKIYAGQGDRPVSEYDTPLRSTGFIKPAKLNPYKAQSVGDLNNEKDPSVIDVDDTADDETNTDDMTTAGDDDNDDGTLTAVSYTHLTLPTIYSV